MRGVVPPRFARPDVKEKGSCGERIGPKPRRHVCVEEQGANTLVKSAENTFGTTILLRCVWTCETKNCAVVRQKSAESKVVELFSIVRLKRKDGTPKLRADIGVKSRQGRERIRLSAQRKSPHIMRIIIKDNQII